jgi:hypothetical protein
VDSLFAWFSSPGSAFNSLVNCRKWLAGSARLIPAWDRTARLVRSAGEKDPDGIGRKSQPELQHVTTFALVAQP